MQKGMIEGLALHISLSSSSSFLRVCSMGRGKRKNPSSSSSYMWWTLWNFDEFSLCFGIEGSSFKPEVELGIIGLGNSTSFNFGIDVYKQCRRDRGLLRHVDVKAQIPSPWIAKFTSLSLRLSSSEVLFCTLDVASIWNCQRQVFLLSTYYLLVEYNLRW